MSGLGIFADLAEAAGEGAEEFFLDAMAALPKAHEDIENDTIPREEVLSIMERIAEASQPIEEHNL